MAENKIIAQGNPEFDWDALANEGYSQAQHAEYVDTYSETLTSINEKEVIKKTVVAISDREVVVNIGYKSEGVIPINEFRYNQDLKVGDEVVVFVESQEDRNGQLVVSHKTARMHHAWDRVNEVLRSEEHTSELQSRPHLVCRLL